LNLIGRLLEQTKGLTSHSATHKRGHQLRRWPISRLCDPEVHRHPGVGSTSSRDFFWADTACRTRVASEFADADRNLWASSFQQSKRQGEL